MGLQKKNLLVLCLCCLHNFCINETIGPTDTKPKKHLQTNDLIIISMGGDIAITNGGNATVKDSGDIGQLLGGGEHFDDIRENEKKRIY